MQSVPENLKESPEYVQTSLAGAICLGLEPGRFSRGAKCHCLNILLTYQSGCHAACSYCGLARNRDPEAAQTFIRVKWPTYSLDELLERVQSRRHPFNRVCVSMLTHPRSVADTCIIMSKFKRITGLPISGLLTPTAMQGKADLALIKKAGADRVGIAIDAATEESFDKHRGRAVNGPHKWDWYWQTLADAIDVFGKYQAGVHLIVGLGETEQEMVQAISKAYQMGALTHLFSFFPEAGSLMDGSPQPPLGQYRRVQLARYLINEGLATAETIKYSPEGQIVDYGMNTEPYVKKGVAFMTSGCPGSDGRLACNRPFSNERASEPMRNYPFEPTPEDLVVVRPQIWDGIEHAE